MISVGLLGIAIAVVLALYVRDIRAIRERVTSDSSVIETRHGQIEYVSWGRGPPVLVVHGAGGGYDQGRLIPQMFGGDGYRWIAVSRFGYLRSDMPDDASTVAQAQAFADLMDALEIDRVAVLAMSGGGPPSLQFAQQYPDRTTALVLLSTAPFTPLAEGETDLPMTLWLYQALFSSDFVFWALAKLYPAGFDLTFDVSAEARARISEPDVAVVEAMIDTFLPVTGRTAGLRNEAAAIDPGTQYDLGKITAPTLVVHARDDGINAFAFGEYTAENIADAEFMPLATGGHLLLGNYETVSERVNSFLSLHAAAFE